MGGASLAQAAVSPVRRHREVRRPEVERLVLNFFADSARFIVKSMRTSLVRTIETRPVPMEVTEITRTKESRGSARAHGASRPTS